MNLILRLTLVFTILAAPAAWPMSDAECTVEVHAAVADFTKFNAYPDVEVNCWRTSLADFSCATHADHLSKWASVDVRLNAAAVNDCLIEAIVPK